MLKSKCLYANGYEWLLVEGKNYEVLSWTNDTIVINDEKCGMFGLDKERFEFKVPEKFSCGFDKVIEGIRYYPIKDE